MEFTGSIFLTFNVNKVAIRFRKFFLCIINLDTLPEIQFLK